MIVWWKIPNLLMSNRQLLEAGLLGNEHWRTTNRIYVVAELPSPQLRLWIGEP